MNVCSCMYCLHCFHPFDFLLTWCSSPGSLRSMEYRLWEFNPMLSALDCLGKRTLNFFQEFPALSICKCDHSDSQGSHMNIFLVYNPPTVYLSLRQWNAENGIPQNLNIWLHTKRNPVWFDKGRSIRQICIPWLAYLYDGGLGKVDHTVIYCHRTLCVFQKLQCM